MSYVCALDAGTTGVRALAIGPAGNVEAQHYRELTQHFPAPGLVEHDAVEITDSLLEVTRKLIAEMEAPPISFGITNQRETVVVWDRETGNPLHHAIVWQDRRGSDRCIELRASHAQQIRRITGLVPDPYFSASKIEWLFANVDLPSSDRIAVGTIDSWLIWSLTGGDAHVTEPSNASRTMLFDLERLDWSSTLCDLFGVPLACLPEIRPSSGIFGHTRGNDGIPDGIPIAGAAGDQQASLFGHGCFTPGMAKNTYGTGSFVLLNVGEQVPRPPDGLLATVAWQLDGLPATYALEGSIFSTGSAVQWLRDGLNVIDAANELEELAASCEDTGGVVFVPAFTGLGSPWWDPDARGSLFGVTRGSGRAELARAVIESMVFQTRDVIDVMTGSVTLQELRVDGGAAAMDLLCSLQATQLSTPVLRARTLETTALGAAFLAGLATGVWNDLDTIADLLQASTRFEPLPDRNDGAFERWRRGVERTRSTFTR